MLPCKRVIWNSTMKILILLSAVTLAFANEPVCGKNQRYLECGTACPLTCKNYANPPKICPAMCVSGCHCEKGYVKTEDGRCVRPEECPAREHPVCGRNQRFEECGSACPLTCDNYDNPPKICPAMCVFGCHCEEGYVKTKDGRCVRPEECPARSNPVCGRNQRFEECGTACPLTCDNYDNPPKICPAMCVSGCHCEKGYVKTKDGRCVRPEKCPARRNPVCGRNQRFEECGTACPLTCDNYDNPPKICPAMCVSGCHCEEGYVKTKNGRCVRPEKCPAKRNVETCLLKPETGRCKAHIPMWYYDAETETCKEFVYGGCQGNANRHASKEECMQNCGNVKKQSSSNVCNLPAEAGVCDAYMPRFFYDSSSGECKRFVYGGCGGNGNNFRTIEECQRVCA